MARIPAAGKSLCLGSSVQVLLEEEEQVFSPYYGEDLSSYGM